MYKFLRNVSTMTGKNFRAGTIVPDGLFRNLDEMVKSGDIEKVSEVVDKVTMDEQIAEVEELNAEEARKAEAARKARERRAAEKAGK